MRCLILGDVDQLEVIAKRLDEHASEPVGRSPDELSQAAAGRVLAGAARFGSARTVLHQIDTRRRLAAPG
jgi:hypothetical protein